MKVHVHGAHEDGVEKPFVVVIQKADNQYIYPKESHSASPPPLA